VSSAGHSDWVLPSIAITIGPLLLWLDRESTFPLPADRLGADRGTSDPRRDDVGNPLVATTGLAAGVLLLATALAGFHDLAKVRRAADRAKARKTAVAAPAGAPL